MDLPGGWAGDERINQGVSNLSITHISSLSVTGF
jgi:hypothetical protein